MSTNASAALGATEKARPTKKAPVVSVTPKKQPPKKTEVAAPAPSNASSNALVAPIAGKDKPKTIGEWTVVASKKQPSPPATPRIQTSKSERVVAPTLAPASVPSMASSSAPETSKAPHNFPTGPKNAPKAPAEWIVVASSQRKSPSSSSPKSNSCQPVGAGASLDEITSPSGSPQRSQRQQLHRKPAFSPTYYNKVARRPAQAPRNNIPLKAVDPVKRIISIEKAFPALPISPEKAASTGSVMVPGPRPKMILLIAPKNKIVATSGSTSLPKNASGAAPSFSYKFGSNQGWNKPVRHELVVEIRASKPGQAESTLVDPAYPLKYLVARSEYFAQKYPNVPESTIGHVRTFHETLQVDADALRQVLDWFMQYPVYMSPNYKGKPQISGKFDRNFVKDANLFQVLAHLDLKVPFAKQFWLRHAIVDHFATASRFTKEDVVQFWKCCNTDEALTKQVLRRVADGVEAMDDKVDQEDDDPTRPNEKQFSQYMESVPELKQAYDSVVMIKSKQLEMQQRFEAQLQRWRVRKVQEKEQFKQKEAVRARQEQSQ